MVFIKNNIILPRKVDMDINQEILNRIAEALERISLILMKKLFI